MTRIWLFLGVASIIFSACVPNRKLVYLQENDLKRRKEIPKDTVLRVRPLAIREYHIQPLDILSVNFETLTRENDEFDFLDKLSPQRSNSGGGSSGGGNSTLSGVIVNGEGEIEYAILGKIKVGGLTLFQAQDTIRRIAARFVPDVVVRVRLLNFRFTILGEVNSENTVVSNNTRLTLMEGIGLAGGLSELADRSHIKILRQKGEQTEIFYVDLLKEEFLESPNYYVQQNDVIIVPPLKQRPFRRYFSNNLALATSAITFGLFIITLSQLDKNN